VHLLSKREEFSANTTYVVVVIKQPCSTNVEHVSCLYDKASQS
jgi:hypothetical protein